MSQIKPFAMSRFVSLFLCEAECERDGNIVYLWEPLHAQKPLTEKDHPRWEDDNVLFYREEQKDWVRVNRHLMFDRGASPDVVILPDGLCVEITGAQIVWRDEHQQWFVRWHGYTHSRFAKLAQQGLEAWKNAA